MSSFNINTPTTNQCFLGESNKSENKSENKSGYVINFATDEAIKTIGLEYSLVYNGNITMHPQATDPSGLYQPYYPIKTSYYIMKNSVIKSVKIEQEIVNLDDDIIELVSSGQQTVNINDFSSMQLIEGKYLTISVNNNTVIATGKTMIQLYIENV